MGDLQEAFRTQRESLELARHLGLRRLEVGALNGLGELHEAGRGR